MKNEVRNFSVYPILLVDDDVFTYAKVHAYEGVIGIGRRVAFQRQGASEWQRGHVVETPDGHSRGGGTVCIRKAA